MDDKERSMPEICWNEGLCVGVAAIDDQHRNLTATINELYQAYAAGRDKAVIERIVCALSDYVAAHFGLEEALMAQSDYPDAEAHKAEHREFLDKTMDFILASVEGREELSVEVLDFLTDWWLKHISGTDMRLAGHLKARGVVW